MGSLFRRLFLVLRAKLGYRARRDATGLAITIASSAVLVAILVYLVPWMKPTKIKPKNLFDFPLSIVEEADSHDPTLTALDCSRCHNSGLLGMRDSIKPDPKVDAEFEELAREIVSDSPIWGPGLSRYALYEED